MNPSQMRTELLGQHAEIRALIDKAQRGSRSALVRLADALRRHNLREEELLGELLPTIDAWGPVRAAIMLEEHVQEHAELWEALLDASDGKRAVAEFATNLLEHIEYEERTLLAEEILEDGAVVQDAFGG